MLIFNRKKDYCFGVNSSYFIHPYCFTMENTPKVFQPNRRKKRSVPRDRSQNDESQTRGNSPQKYVNILANINANNYTFDPRDVYLNFANYNDLKTFEPCKSHLCPCTNFDLYPETLTTNYVHNSTSTFCFYSRLEIFTDYVTSKYPAIDYESCLRNLRGDNTQCDLTECFILNCLIKTNIPLDLFNNWEFFSHRCSVNDHFLRSDFYCNIFTIMFPNEDIDILETDSDEDSDYYSIFSEFSDQFDTPILLDVIKDPSNFSFMLNAPGSESYINYVENLIMIFFTIDWSKLSNVLATGCKLIKSTMEFLNDGKPFLISTNIVNKLKDILTTTDENIAAAGTDEAEAKYKTFKQVVKYPFFQNVIKFFAYVITMPFCDNLRTSMNHNGLREFTKYMHKSVAQESVFSMGELFFDSFFHFVKKIPMYCKTGDFSVFELENFSTFYSKAAWCYEKEYHRTHFIETELCVSVSEYNVKLNEAINMGNAILKKADNDKQFSNTRTSVRNELSNLLAIKQRLNALGSNSKSRIKPFGVLFYGFPKVGKTDIMDKCRMVFGNVNDLPLNSECYYTRNVRDPFWSGFSSSIWATTIDDAADASEKCLLSDDSVNEIIAIMNTMPYPLNMADLGSKGTTFFQSRYFAVSTNEKLLNAHWHKNTPIATWRRFHIYITIEVRDEFRPDGTDGGARPNCIDDNKVLLWKKNNPGLQPELNNYVIQRPKMIPGKTHKIDFETLYTCDNQESFYKAFVSCVEQYNTVEKSLRESREISQNDSFCEHKIFTSMCSECMPVAAAGNDNVIEEFNFLSSFYVLKCLITAIFSTLYLTFTDYRSQGPIYQIMSNLTWKQKYRLGIVYLQMHGRNQNNINFANYLNSMQVTAIDKFNIVEKGFKAKNDDLNKMLQESGNPLRTHHCAAIISALFLITLWYKNRTPKESLVSKIIDHKYDSPIDNVAATGPPDYYDSIKMPSKPPENEYKYKEVNYSLPKAHPGRTADINKFTELVKDNIISYHVTYPGTPLNTKIEGFAYAVCVYGRLYMTVAHAFKRDADIFTIHYSRGNSSTPHHNVVSFRREDIYFDINEDVAFFHLTSSPCRKNISKYLLNEVFDQPTDGHLIYKYKDVVSQPTTLQYITYKFKDELNTSNNMTFYGDLYSVTNPGIVSDCGTPHIIETPSGFALSGFICAITSKTKKGYEESKIKTYIRPVLSSHVEKAVNYLEGNGLVIAATSSGDVNLHSYSLSKLHAKSRFNWLDDSYVEIYGTLNVPRSKPKSSFSETILIDTVKEFYNVKPMRAPLMRTGNIDGKWQDAYRYNLEKKISYPFNVPEGLVIPAYNAFLADILPNSSKEYIRVLSYYEALNGVPKERFIDSMNMSSSTGFPTYKKKRDVLISQPTEVNPDGLYFTKKDEDDLIEMDLVLRSGIQVHPMLSAHLKDNPTTYADFDKGKTRIFQGMPFLFNVLTRKYFLTISKLFMENNLQFECAAGCNAMSKDWTYFGTFLKFSPNLVNGDFSAYDLKMCYTLLYYAFCILIKIAEHNGYTEVDIIAMRAIAEDIIYNFTIFDGDVIQFLMGHASGECLTVIINCIINSMLMRIIFKKFKYNINAFKQYVKLLTYGDDNIMAVSPQCPLFNQVYITEQFATIGITYTMADKESEVIPYIDFEQASFLKRKWAWNEQYKIYLCPLEFDSLTKSLCYRLDSKYSTPPNHAKNVLENFQRELVQHGRAQYKRGLRCINKCIKKVKLDNYVNVKIFSYEEMLHEIYG